jgi:predicted DNA-binding transcriptional regulator AlpA
MVAQDRILRLPEVAEMLTLEPQTLYAMRSEGRGPKSFKLGGRVVYRESAVREWLQELEQAEDERLAQIHANAG